MRFNIHGYNGQRLWVSFTYDCWVGPLPLTTIAVARDRHGTVVAVGSVKRYVHDADNEAIAQKLALRKLFTELKLTKLARKHAYLDYYAAISRFDADRAVKAIHTQRSC